MPAKVRRAKRRARSTWTAEDFSEYLDPGGVIPEDPERLSALSSALIAANGGRTLGPVADAVEVFLADPGDRLADYLTEHAAWYHRPLKENPAHDRP